jgi:Na+/H+-translocating membrane pyrophosphatase
MAVTVYISFNLCLMYGVALAALGVLSTMATGLTIDAYGPIADNAGGIVEMAELIRGIRGVTDDLDAAGNTTAAIGKGFAISSAAFVALALYGAFVTHCGIPSVNIVDARTFPGLLVGAMLPYWFSGMTMTSVNKAAMGMVMEIKRQFEDKTPYKGSTRGEALMNGDLEADHGKCVEAATNDSLHYMIAPASLVMFSPIICGVFFGKECLAGLLPGATISGVEMAISMSNTGGAWDNAKKYIEGGQMVLDKTCSKTLDDVIAEEVDAELHIVRKKKDWQSVAGGKPTDDEGELNDKDTPAAWKTEILDKIKASKNNITFGKYSGVELMDKDHEVHSAAVIGDTVGDPLKDTSGPALNILVKLMAIISVVIVPVVNGSFGGLIFNHWLKNFSQCASVHGGCDGLSAPPVTPATPPS